MDNKEFESVFDGAVSTARALLVEKAKEYASDVDRLHNFKAAAGALNITPELALRGMSTKHTISVNDMVKDPDKYTMAQWEEKLGDELNYILLLKALVWERLNDNADREVKDDILHFSTWSAVNAHYGADTKLESSSREDADFVFVAESGAKYYYKRSEEAELQALREKLLPSSPNKVPGPRYYPNWTKVVNDTGYGRGSYVKLDQIQKSKRGYIPGRDIIVGGATFRKIEN